MTEFWENITGSEQDAFAPNFTAIPEGTHAVAEIKVVEFLQPQDKRPMYEVKWKIVGGDFKNRMIFQKIRCFDEDESKAIRQRNILMLLFKTANVPIPAGQPLNHDLAHFQGRICNIKIGLMKADDGKEYNFVREIHSADYVPVSPVDSAFSRNASRPMGLPDDGIPFL